MLFAVHISDGGLAPMWCIAGFLGAAALLWLAAWRLREEEIPLIALLAAAAFVASSIHLPVPPTSIHLLLNGLVGVILGLRAPLAIAVGLLFQVVLLQHGGFQTLGANICVLACPALLAGVVFRGLCRLTCLRRPWFRSLLMTLSALAWCWCLVFSLAMVSVNSLKSLEELDYLGPLSVAFSPLALAGCAAAALLAAWIERRLDNSAEFPLGMVIGLGAVLFTITLNCGLLLLGGQDFGTTTALALVVCHLPLALVEGLVVGSAVGFLCRVKPALLGMSRPMERAQPATPGPAQAPGSEAPGPLQPRAGAGTEVVIQSR